MSDLFAITQTGGQSQLMSIDVGVGASPVASLGSAIVSGGLAYRPSSRSLYSVSQGGASPSLLSFGFSGQMQQQTGSLPAGLTGGLAYHAPDDALYGISNTGGIGLAMLHKISLSGVATPLFPLGQGQWGGLVYERLRDRFFALSTDNTGFTWFYEFTLQGQVSKLMGAGLRASGGLAYALHQDLFYFVGNDANDGVDHLHTLALNGDVRHSMQLGPGFEGASLAVTPWFGGVIDISSPLRSERFVSGEAVHLDARVLDVSGNPLADSSDLSWSSDIDGNLGTGPTDHQLSVGTHAITLSGHGLSRARSVRVFADLWELYQARPASAEIDRVLGDFTFNWIDDSAGDPTKSWASYPGFPFDQSSTDPSKTAVIAKLDVLRHQRFAQPTPFSEGLTLYEFVKTHTRTINVTLDTALNDAGGGVMHLNRSFTLWTNRYVDSLYLLIHENRHNQPGDPSHTSCTAWTGAAGIPNGMDAVFEPGSGYAYSALYLMWLYKYSSVDTSATKLEARNLVGIFKDRFCARPSSSNPLIQSLLVELWNV